MAKKEKQASTKRERKEPGRKSELKVLVDLTDVFCATQYKHSQTTNIIKVTKTQFVCFYSSVMGQ